MAKNKCADCGPSVVADGLGIGHSSSSNINPGPGIYREHRVGQQSLPRGTETFSHGQTNDEHSDTEALRFEFASSSSETSELASIPDGLQCPSQLPDTRSNSASLQWLPRLPLQQAMDEQARINVHSWVDGLNDDTSVTRDMERYLTVVDSDLESNSTDTFAFDLTSDFYEEFNVVRVESGNSLSLKGSMRSWTSTHDFLNIQTRVLPSLTEDNQPIAETRTRRMFDNFLRLTDDVRPLAHQRIPGVHESTLDCLELRCHTAFDDEGSNGHQFEHQKYEQASKFLRLLDPDTGSPVSKDVPEGDLPCQQATVQLNIPLMVENADAVDSNTVRCKKPVVNTFWKTNRQNIRGLYNEGSSASLTEQLLRKYPDGEAFLLLEDLVVTHDSVEIPCSEESLILNPSSDSNGTPELCTSISEVGESSIFESGLHPMRRGRELVSSLPAFSTVEQLITDLAQTIYKQWTDQKESVSIIAKTCPGLTGDQKEQVSSNGLNNAVFGDHESMKKRTRIENDGNDNSDKEDSNRRHGRDRDGLPQEALHDESQEQRLLACPYYKHDPVKYSGRNMTEAKYRGCSSRLLRDIARVKQHLHRVHEQPRFYCPRCYETFKQRSDMDLHSRQTNPCVLEEPKFTECMSDDMALEIKKKRPKVSTVDAWFKIWAILFPIDPAPSSPFMENAANEEISLFLGYFRRLTPEVIRTHLQQQHHPSLVYLDDTLLQDVIDAAGLLIVQNIEIRGSRIAVEGFGITSGFAHGSQLALAASQQITMSAITVPSIAQTCHTAAIFRNDDRTWVPSYQFLGHDQTIASGGQSSDRMGVSVAEDSDVSSVMLNWVNFDPGYDPKIPSAMDLGETRDENAFSWAVGESQDSEV